jgi:hypothetical protein
MFPDGTYYFGQIIFTAYGVVGVVLDEAPGNTMYYPLHAIEYVEMTQAHGTETITDESVD